MSVPGAERAEEIFVAAQELEPEEREAFVERSCAGNEELRREVNALLAAASQAEGFFADLSDRLGLSALLRKSRGDDSRPGPGHQSGGRPGQRVGQYTLTAPIGSGGMGTVWHAERSDGRFEGQVAIKLLAAGGVAARRFEMEGRYLAKLTHPNIARLLDAGVTESGEPYLVLEYVDGKPIDQYCDERRLDIRSRIRLYSNVLSGVAHAHAHLIVHRDIKPSNVLVANDGTVKLLDFGIAKLLDTEGGFAGRGVTRDFGMSLTPEFAAPEQFLGEPVTTATDVYSLGLVLYVLLAGCHPQPREPTDSLVDLQVVACKAAPRLSDILSTGRGVSAETITLTARYRGASPDALRRALRGDLDNIVRKALAVDPDERYGTVADFAADLRRYLADEPVSARPPTIGYRITKFMRRHRRGVLAASVMTLMLIGAILLTVWQSIEARRQRDAAIDQQQRVQASNEFLTLLLEEIGPEGEALTVVELLDRGVAMLDQYGEQPFVGRMLYNVAQRYAALGATERTHDLLLRAEGMARDQQDRDLLAAVLCTRARIQIVNEPDESRAWVNEADRLLDEIRAPSQDSLVACARADALMVEIGGDRPRAIEILQAARKALGAGPEVSAHLRSLVLNDLSSMYFKMDQLDKTLELNDEILALKGDIDRSDTIGYLLVLLSRAETLHNLGEIAEALEIREEVLDRVQELEEAGRGPVGFWEAYASSLIRLNRYEEALRLVQENRGKAEALGNIAAVAQSDLQMGRTLMLMGRHVEATPYLDSAESVFREAPGTYSRSLHHIALARAQIQVASGDAPGGRAAIDAVLANLGYPADKTGPGLKNALRVAAKIALASGDAEDAEAFATEFFEMSAAIARDPAFSADVGQALLLRAEARLALGKTTDARNDLHQAIESLTNGLGAQHPDTRQAHSLLSGL